jgi:hypothetical protein
MRTFLVFSVIVVVVLFGAVVALALQVLPYVFLGMVIGAVIRGRRSQRSRVYRAPMPPPQRPRAPGGWAYAPVWVGPPPQRTGPVIDAEVVRDPRDG